MQQDATKEKRIAYVGKSKRKGLFYHHPRLRSFELVLCLILVFALVNGQIHRYATLSCGAEASLFFSSLVNNAVTDALKESGVDYQDLIHLKQKENGDVASLSANMTRLLTLRTDVCRTLYSALKSVRAFSVSIPLGNLSGIDLFAGRGAPLRIKVQPSSSFRALFLSEFREAGINQTLHRIIFHIEADFLLLFPLKTHALTLNEDFCVAETIIVGTVPDAYTDITRLTDEITESDIDDIYDFGAEPMDK